MEDTKAKKPAIMKCSDSRLRDYIERNHPSRREALNEVRRRYRIRATQELMGDGPGAIRFASDLFLDLSWLEVASEIHDMFDGKSLPSNQGDSNEIDEKDGIRF